MNNKDSFDQLFDQMMAPEKIEDAGFSPRVLSSLHTLEASPQSPFSWRLIFLSLSVMAAYFYLGWDLVVYRQFLMGIELTEILAQVGIPHFTISLSPTTLMAIAALIIYGISHQFIRLTKDI